MISAPSGQVTILPDAGAVAAALADAVIAAATAAIAARGTFSIALAGGSSPRAAYELLAGAEYRECVDWSRILCLFGDERCVAPTDDQSNFKMASQALLDHVAIPRENIVRMRGEDEPGQAAAAYADELCKRLGPAPVIDLVLLGLGPDAHTASWFPGVAINDDLLVDAPFVPKFGTNRLTLTPHVVNAARAVLVATTGSEKSAALAAVLGKERDSLRYPAQRLAPASGKLTWLVDSAAASAP